MSVRTSARRLTAADGVELAYWISIPSAETDRALVLLHGVASNHTRWSEFVERTTLTGSWAVVWPDLRGNGESMTRSGQTIDAWCSDLLEILEAERLPGAIFVGHSLGAQVAVHLAHRSPDRVNGLVLIDPVVGHSLTGRPGWWYRNRWILRLAALKIRVLNALGLRRRRIANRDIRALDEETREALRGEGSFEEIARRYKKLGPILAHMPSANYLSQVLATIAPLPPLEGIEVPVLAVQSTGVTFADAEVNRAEIRRLPHVEVTTVSANHWPLTEAPEETRRVIESWVGRSFPL
jgi:pimeloyl-ACP methyl ester carboxylesterase